MLGARSVAVVGASPRPDSFGARMVIEGKRSSARLHLVNPRYDRIDGVACAPPVDTDGLAAVIAGFSRLATELGDVLDAAEANPVITSPTGAIAVDAPVIPRDQKIE